MSRARKHISNKGLYRLSIWDLKDILSKKQGVSATIILSNDYMNNEVVFTTTVKHDTIYLMDKKFIHSFSLLKQPCYFGGSRYWFRCHCGRQAGVLYFHNNVWACRHCHNIIYETQLQNRHSMAFLAIRLLRKSQKVTAEHGKYFSYNGKLTKRARKHMKQMEESFKLYKTIQQRKNKV